MLRAIVCVLTFFSSLPLSAQPVSVDVLLKGGTIYDGTGSKPVVGDLGIKGETIVAVGTFESAGTPHVIDCTGLIVAPGFIDLHNHSDWGIVTREKRANLNFLTQGCTTVVTGNCGAGPLDAAKYYTTIDEHGAGTNVAHLLPQGNLRSEVIGDEDRRATVAEIERMGQLARQAMRDGAWGMSTGLIYVPSVYADTSELIAIARVVGEAGGIYVSHMRGEGESLLAAVAELLEIGREAKLPVHASHFKSSGRENWGLIRQATEMIQGARANGQVATADQYPYIASSTSLDATVIPTWARAGSRTEMIARFDDPELGPKIRTQVQRSLDAKLGGEAILFARFAKRPDWVGLNLAQVATKEGKTPLEIAEFVARNQGATIVNFSMSEEDVRFAMQVEWVATASDGRTEIPGADKPHPRFYGTFPRKIGHYSIREEVLPLAQAIRSASGLPADILGMTDRGYLKPSLAADIVVFDPHKYIDTATFQEPHQYASGVQYLYVNGTPAIFGGHPTGALAGKALRKPRPASEK